MSDEEEVIPDYKAKRLETLARAREVARQNRLAKTNEKKIEHKKVIDERKIERKKITKEVKEKLGEITPITPTNCKEPLVEPEPIIEEKEQELEEEEPLEEIKKKVPKKKPKKKVVYESESDSSASETEEVVIVKKKKIKPPIPHRVVYKEPEKSIEQINYEKNLDNKLFNERLKNIFSL